MYQKIFKEIVSELETFEDTGKVANYIPELGLVDPNKFGVHLTTLDNQQFSCGDFDEKFSIQSIAKVLVLIPVYLKKDTELWKRVGVEPPGTPFNSLVQLEADCGIPRNPLINAGAMVVCDVFISLFENPKKAFLDFIRKVSDNPAIDFNSKIACSEKDTGFRNAALVNLIKAFGNIKNSVDEVLDFYFHLCSIEMTCQELSRTFLFLANHGVDPLNNQKFLPASKSKRVMAIMQTCGFYDEAGEFSFKVGLPGKSGVGGGIVAIHPGKYSVALWSPRLNAKGNSAKGMRFLELLTSKTESSIF